MGTIIQFIGCTILAVGLSGCATNQLGPVRPITVEQDVALAKALIDDDLLRFPNADFVTEAGMRNEIVTARMYIIDVEYDYYEARLTREMQDEGLLATATELGLTTAATLVPVVQTKTLLSALATGVVGLDKAYNEKELLSNTVQALQTQMRADRKREAAVIYAVPPVPPGPVSALVNLGHRTTNPGKINGCWPPRRHRRRDAPSSRRQRIGVLCW